MTTASNTTAARGFSRSFALLAAGWLAACAVALAAAGDARAALGETFGLIPINGPDQPLVPALPDASSYFWAGTCDTATAPAVGEPIPGGIGSRPASSSGPGGGPALVTPPQCIDPGSASNGGSQTWSVPPAWRLAPRAQAGGHPDGTATFAFEKKSSDVDGALDNIVVDLPPGFVGDPNAVPECTAEQFAIRPQQCPPESQVGVLDINLFASEVSGNFNNTNVHTHPVFNLEPREGNAAELGLVYLSSEGRATARLVAKARTNGDFGVTTFIGQVPAALPLHAQTITIWGVPWAGANDLWRAPQGFRPGAPCTPQVGLPSDGLPATSGCRQSYDPSWGPVRPFLSNVTGGSFAASSVGGCDGSVPSTRLMIDAFQQPGAMTVEGDPDLSDSDWKVYDSSAPLLEGCDRVPFAADVAFSPTSSVADAASGLNVDLAVGQNRQPPFDPPTPGASQGEVDAYVAAAAAYWKSDAGLATGHLKDSVVSLPAGVAVNPSGATGLAGCSDAEVGLRQQGDPPLFNNVDPVDGVGVECPSGSVIGTAEVDTPLLDDPLTGQVILGEPKSTDPRSGEMLRLFLVVRDKSRGVLAKVYGSTVADPATGKLTATFANNPRVPFERLRLQFKGGERGVLANPQDCGSPGWSSTFVPWSEDPGESDQTVIDTGAFAIDAGCGTGFAPGLTAGMSTPRARRHGTFSFEFTRPQGQEWLSGLTARLPEGLLAAVKGVSLCSDAQASSGSCPAGSRIGIVDASAGSGDPFVLEHKGEVFLTEGYKGGPYGLLVRVRAVAGPFRGAMELSPILVRQAIHVDPTTAEVSAVSDPFPLVHHGVPLRVRRVLVSIDRPRFMLNPSDCTPSQVVADFASADGAHATAASRFQAAGCAALPFKPRLALRLTGRRQTRTGKHPGVRATVRQKGVGEAGIEKAVVRLPKTLALDVDNAQALCEHQDGTRPDLESHCPRGSIVGRARAVSPLLKRPLAGDVYFVKNVRIDKKTGNAIRTLPMIVVALRGEIAINLKGKSSVTRSGRLVNTFNQVPDAPVNRFNLNIKGGRNGILAITRTRRGLIDLCKTGRQIAQADLDAHNGKRLDRDIRIKTPCKARRGDAKRRKAVAKREAAKRKKARR